MTSEGIISVSIIIIIIIIIIILITMKICYCKILITLIKRKKRDANRTMQEKCCNCQWSKLVGSTIVSIDLSNVC